MFLHDKRIQEADEEDSENPAQNKKKRQRSTTKQVDPNPNRAKKTKNNSEGPSDSECPSDSEGDNSDSDSNAKQAIDLFRTDYSNVENCFKKINGQLSVPLYFHHKKKNEKYKLVVEKKNDKEIWLPYDETFDDDDRADFQEQIKNSDRLRQEHHLEDLDFEDPYSIRQKQLESKIMEDPSKFKCVDMSENDKEAFKCMLQKSNDVVTR